jgi:hypothetical protein
VVLGACLHAAAQAPAKPPGNPNEAAKALAQRLGSERNAEGLQAILEARNTDLLAAYERGLRQWSMGAQQRPVALPPAIEALMVRHYADPAVGGPLRALCAANGTVYRSRELFDLFFAEWRSRKVRPSAYPMYDSALQTDQPGVDAALLGWLMAADAPAGEERRRMIHFLARRQYSPAHAAFVAMLRKGGDPDATTLAWVLLDMGRQDGIEAVLDQVAEWRRNPPKDQPDAWERYAARIAGLPDTVAIPYKRFQAILPEGDRRYAVTWFSKRKDVDALADVYLQLGDEKQFGAALGALIATDSPETWKRARAEVERLNGEGRLKGGQYLHATTLLDPKIRDPARHLAEKRDVERTQRFTERRAKIEAAKNEARKYRKSEPERYLAGLHGALAEEERLLAEFAGIHMIAYAREQVAAEYLEAGHVVRFRLQRPRQALEEYARAERLGSKLGGLGVADLREHELRDKPGAIAQYRKLLGEVRAVPAPPGEQGATQRWMARWLEAQLRFLEKGEVFSGAVTRDDVAGGVAMAMVGMTGRDEALELGALEGYVRDAFGAGARPPDRRQVARILQPLPASAFVLMRTAWFVGLLPDADAILSYLARQDPAGFGSASIFAVADHVQKDDSGGSMLLSPGLAEDPRAPSPLATAKDRFLRERRIRVVP